MYSDENKVANPPPEYLLVKPKVTRNKSKKKLLCMFSTERK